MELFTKIRDFNPIEEVFGNWTAVDSSNVAAYRYNPGTRVLQIRFKSGRIYGYRDVPQNIVDEFANAESKGKFVNASIKHNYSLE